MTVKVIGSSSRFRIFDPFVQFGHPPIFQSASSDSPSATQDNHQPSGSAASSKGGVRF
jgi:hypothetical protein